LNVFLLDVLVGTEAEGTIQSGFIAEIGAPENCGAGARRSL